jgi:hypothetical protein
MDLQQNDIPRNPFNIYELLSKILSFLPRSIFNSQYDPARDSNLTCARVCGNWHKVSRLYAFWIVYLGGEENARRFLAALVSNEAFAERNPGWPRMNSTRSLVIDDVSGLFLILKSFFVGDTASQILCMLPKLEELRRDDSPMSFDELSTVSKNLVSLACLQGFDFDHVGIDISSLVFPCLENVKLSSDNASDMQFIANVLENSIPQGRVFLKSLVLRSLRSAHPTTNSSVDYAQVKTSLIKVIEV